MQGPYLRKYGVQTTINFVLYETDGVDLKVDAADAGADCSIMKDEGAEATCTNDFADEGKGYSLVLDATEMSAARVVVYVVDSATKVWLDDSIVIETYGNASAMHAFDLDTAQQSVNIAAITAGIIANASFNADVGSTAHGTNNIALACRKILEELNLDHLLKVDTTVAADGDLEAYCVAGTIMAHVLSTGADVTTFKASTDSLQSIRDAAAGNITSIMGTALTESTGGNLANNMSTFWDNADALTVKTVDDVGAPASGGGSPLVIGRGDVGDFKENGIVYFLWNTIDRSGAAVAPSTAGTVKVYKDDGTSEVTAPTGITDGRAHDGVTGLHDCKIDLNNATQSFYEKGKNYSVVLTGAVIDTKTVNVTIASFSIENRWANVHYHYGGK